MRLLLALAGLVLAPDPAEAAPLRDRAQAAAQRATAQRSLLRQNAGTIRADAAAARVQARQLRAEAVLNSESFRRQETMLARAMQQGNVRVARPQFLDVVLAADASGLLPESTTVDYLRWRQGLNPTRFNQVHPMIAPILDRDRIVRNQAPIPLPPVIIPDPPTIPPVVIPPTTPTTPRSPQVPVPEPGSLVLWAAIGLGGAFAVSRRRRPSS